MSDAITDAMIDAGAKALRERQQSGKRLNDWDALPKATKLKWWGHAHAVLIAARNAARDREDTEEATAIAGETIR